MLYLHSSAAGTVNAECGPLPDEPAPLNYKCHVAVAQAKVEIPTLKQNRFLIFIGTGPNDQYFRVTFDALLGGSANLAGSNQR